MCMERESLGDMSSRFYHLLSEMGNIKFAATPKEVVTKFADALTAQWNGFLEILKYNGTLATTNIHDFIQLLENKNQDEMRKAKRVPVPQNPEIYYGNCGGTSTVARPAQHAQLQMAFVSSTDMYGTSQPAAPEQSYQSTLLEYHHFLIQTTKVNNKPIMETLHQQSMLVSQLIQTQFG
ncbi:hypothetical protein HanRHA438_Chr13g0584851 [Helianthus annuus]|nr:hypothetical protein HanRHA438_Chr13g0584851 [Helianthus annuus]